MSSKNKDVLDIEEFIKNCKELSGIYGAHDISANPNDSKAKATQLTAGVYEALNGDYSNLKSNFGTYANGVKTITTSLNRSIDDFNKAIARLERLSGRHKTSVFGVDYTLDDLQNVIDAKEKFEDTSGRFIQFCNDKNKNIKIWENSNKNKQPLTSTSNKLKSNIDKIEQIKRIEALTGNMPVSQLAESSFLIYRFGIHGFTTQDSLGNEVALDRKGKSSRYMIGNEKSSWKTQDEMDIMAKYLEQAQAKSLTIMHDNEVSDKYYNMQSAKYFVQNKNSGAVGKNIYFDIETVGQKGSKNFGITEIGYRMNGKDHTILCRLTTDMTQDLMSLVEEGMSYQAIGEDKGGAKALNDWYANLKKYDPTLIFGLQRMMGKFTHSGGAHNITGRDKTMMRDFQASTQITFKDLEMAKANIKKLSSSSLPTTEEVIDHLVNKEWVDNLANGGNLVSFNGTMFDTGSMLAQAGNNRTKLDKLFQEKHLDLRSVALMLGKDFMSSQANNSSNRNTMAFNLRAYIDRYLSQDSIKELLKESKGAGWHAAAQDTHGLELIYKEFTTNPKLFGMVLSASEHIAKIESANNKQNAQQINNGSNVKISEIEVGSFFVAKKSYFKRTREDFYVRADKLPLQNAGKEFITARDFQTAKYNSVENSFFSKGQVIQFLGVTQIENGTYYSRFRNLVTGSTCMVHYDTLEEARQSMSGLYGEKITKKQISNKQLTATFHKINRGDFDYYGAQRLFDGFEKIYLADKDGNLRVYNNFGEALKAKENKELIDSTTEGKAVMRVYQMYQNLKTQSAQKFTSGQKLMAFNEALSQIQYHGSVNTHDFDVEDFLRKNLHIHQAIGSNANLRFDINAAIRLVKENPNLLGSTRNANKVVKSIERMREEDAGSWAIYDVLYREISNALGVDESIKSTYAKRVLNSNKQITGTKKYWEEKLLKGPRVVDVDEMTDTAKLVTGLKGEQIIRRINEADKSKSRLVGMINKANPVAKDEDYKKMLEHSIAKETIGGYLDQIAAAYARHGIQMELETTANNSVMLRLYNVADTKVYGKGKSKIAFELPIEYQPGIAKWHNQDVANAIVPIIEKDGNVIHAAGSDLFTRSIGEFAKWITSEEVMDSFASGRVTQGSALAARLITAGKEAITNVVESVSPLSEFGKDPNLIDDRKTGITAQQRINRMTTIQWDKFNRDIINNFGDKYFKNEMARRNAFTELSRYVLLRSMALQSEDKESKENMNTLAHHTLERLFTSSGPITEIEKLYDSDLGNILKLTPISFADTSEEKALEGIYRTLGASRYTDLGSGIDNRKLSQMFGNSLRRSNRVNDNHMDTRGVNGGKSAYGHLVHKAGTTTQFMEDELDKYYKQTGNGLTKESDLNNMHYYTMESDNNKAYAAWSAFGQFLNANYDSKAGTFSNRVMSMIGYNQEFANELLDLFPKLGMAYTKTSSQGKTKYSGYYNFGFNSGAFSEGEMMVFLKDVADSLESAISHSMTIANKDLTYPVKAFYNTLKARGDATADHAPNIDILRALIPKGKGKMPVDVLRLKNIEFNLSNLGHSDQDNTITSLRFNENGDLTILYTENYSLDKSAIKAAGSGALKGGYTKLPISASNPIAKFVMYMSGVNTVLDDGNNNKMTPTQYIKMMSDLAISNPDEYAKYVSKLNTVGIQHGKLKAVDTAKYGVQNLSSKLNAMIVNIREGSELVKNGMTIQHFSDRLNLIANGKDISYVKDGQIYFRPNAGNYMSELYNAFVGEYTPETLRALGINEADYSKNHAKYSLGAYFFGNNYKYIKDVGSSTIGLFQEFDYAKEHGRGSEGRRGEEGKGKFKVGQKTLMAMRRGMSMAGISKEESDYLDSVLIKRSNVHKFAQTVVKSMMNFWNEVKEPGQKPSEITTSLVLDPQGGAEKSNQIKLNDASILKAWSFHNKPEPEEIAEWMQTMWNATKHQDGQEFAYGYVDLSHFNNGEGIELFKNLNIDKLPFLIYNPSLIMTDKAALDKSGLIEMFMGMNNIFQKISQGGDVKEITSSISDYLKNTINGVRRNEYINNAAYKFDQDEASWKKSMQSIPDNFLKASSTGFFDNAAFLNPESLKRMMKYAGSNKKGESGLKNNVLELYELAKNTAGFTMNPSNAQIIDDALNQGKTSNLRRAEDLLLNTLIQASTITNIEVNNEGVILFHINGSDEALTEEEMWKVPFLNYMIRRFPEINEASTQPVRVYGYSNVAIGSAQAGLGVYELMNGDWDGDAIQFWRALSNASAQDIARTKQSLDIMTKFNDYRSYMRGRLKKYSKLVAEDKKTNAYKAQEEWEKDVIGVMSKFNKNPLGEISLRNTAVRSALSKFYDAEKGQRISYGDQALQTIVSGFGQFLEQEIIVAKNVGEIFARLKASGTKITVRDAYERMFAASDINDALSKWTSDDTGNPDRDSEYFTSILSSLKKLGIAEQDKNDGESYILGRVAHDMIVTLGGYFSQYVGEQDGYQHMNTLTPNEQSNLIAKWFNEKVGVNPNKPLTLSELITTKKDALMSITKDLFGPVGEKMMSINPEIMAKLIVASANGVITADTQKIYLGDRVDALLSDVVLEDLNKINARMILGYFQKAGELFRTGRITGTDGKILKNVFSTALYQEFQSGEAFSPKTEERWREMLEKAYKSQELQLYQALGGLRRKDGLASPDMGLDPYTLRELLQGKLEKYSPIRSDQLKNIWGVKVNEAHKYADLSGKVLIDEYGAKRQVSSSQFGSGIVYGDDVTMVDSQVDALMKALLSNNTSSMEELTKIYGVGARNNLYKREYGNVVHKYFEILGKSGWEKNGYKFTKDVLTGKSSVLTAEDKQLFENFNIMFAREKLASGKKGDMYDANFIHRLSATANRIKESFDSMFGAGKWITANAEYAMAAHYTPLGAGNSAIFGATIDQLIAVFDENNEFSHMVVNDWKNKAHGTNEEVGFQLSFMNLLLNSQLGEIYDLIKGGDESGAKAKISAMLPFYSAKKADADKWRDQVYSKIGNFASRDDVYSLIQNTAADLNPNDPNADVINITKLNIGGIGRLANRYLAGERLGSEDEDNNKARWAYRNLFYSNSNRTGGNIYGVTDDMIDKITARYIMSSTEAQSKLSGPDLAKSIFGENNNLTEDQKFAIGTIWKNLNDSKFKSWVTAAGTMNPFTDIALRVMNHQAEYDIMASSDNNTTERKDEDLYNKAYNDILDTRLNLYQKLSKSVTKYSDAVVKGDKRVMTLEEKRINGYLDAIATSDDIKEDARIRSGEEGDAIKEGRESILRDETTSILNEARTLRREGIISDYNQLTSELEISTRNKMYGKSSVDRLFAAAKVKDISAQLIGLSNQYKQISSEIGSSDDEIPVRNEDNMKFISKEAKEFASSFQRTSDLRNQLLHLQESTGYNDVEIKKVQNQIIREGKIRKRIAKSGKVDQDILDDIAKDAQVSMTLSNPGKEDLREEYAKLEYEKAILGLSSGENELSKIVSDSKIKEINSLQAKLSNKYKSLYKHAIPYGKNDIQKIQSYTVKDAAKRYYKSLENTTLYNRQKSALSKDKVANKDELDRLQKNIDFEENFRNGIISLGYLPSGVVDAINTDYHGKYLMSAPSASEYQNNYLNLMYGKIKSERMQKFGSPIEQIYGKQTMSNISDAMPIIEEDYKRDYGKDISSDFALASPETMSEIVSQEGKQYLDTLQDINSYKQAFDQLSMDSGNDQLTSSLQNKISNAQSMINDIELSNILTQTDMVALQEEDVLSRRLRFGDKQKAIDEYNMLAYQREVSLETAKNASTDAERSAASDQASKIYDNMTLKALDYQRTFGEDISQAPSNVTGQISLNDRKSYEKSLRKSEALQRQIDKLMPNWATNIDEITTLSNAKADEVLNMSAIAKRNHLSQNDINQLTDFMNITRNLKFGGKAGMKKTYDMLAYKRSIADQQRQNGITDADRAAAAEQFDALTGQMAEYASMYSESYGGENISTATGLNRGEIANMERQSYASGLNRIQSLRDRVSALDPTLSVNADDIDFLNQLISEEERELSAIEGRGYLSQADIDKITNDGMIMSGIKNNNGRAGLEDQYAKLVYERQRAEQQRDYGSSALERETGALRYATLDKQIGATERKYQSRYHQAMLTANFGGIEGDIRVNDYNDFSRSLDMTDRLESKIEVLQKDPVGNRAKIEYLQQKIAAEEARRNKIKGNKNIGQKEIDEINIQHSIKKKLNHKDSKVKSQFGKDAWGLLKSSFQSYLSYGVIYQGIGNLVNSLKGLYNTMVQLNTAAAELRIVTGKSSSEASGLIRSYQKLGKELGTTTAVIAKSADEWLRQGYSIAEANTLVESSIKLSKLGMIDSAKATSYLTSTIKGFSLEATDAISVVDKLTTLDMNYATSAGDIAEAMSRVASVAHDANMGLDSTAAMLTTVMDITQMDSSMAGTALRSMLARYGSINTSDYTKSISGEDMEGVNDIEKVLKTIGITIRESGGSMKAFDDVLSDVAEKWINLTDIQKNAISTAMAGTRQRNAFVSLVSNYDQVQEAKKLSENSEGQANIKYDAYMESVAYQMERIKNAWESVGLAFEDDETIRLVLEGFADALEKLIPIVTTFVQLLAALSVRKLSAKLAGIKQYFSGLSNIFKTGVKKLTYKKTDNPELQRQMGVYKTAFNNPATKGQTGYQYATQSAKITHTKPSTQGMTLTRSSLTLKKWQNKVLPQAQLAVDSAQTEYDRVLDAYQRNPTDANAAALARADSKLSEAEFRLEQAKYNADPNNNPETGTSWGNAAIYGAISAASGFTAGNQSAASSLFSDIYGATNKTGLGSDATTLMDVKSTFGDRATSAALQGSLGAIGAEVGGTAGAIAFAAVGDVLATGIKYLAHAEEIAMADRVKLANKVIEKMDDINSVIESINSLTTKKSFSEYGSEDWTLYSKFIREAKSNMYSENTETEYNGVDYSLEDTFLSNLSDMRFTYSSASEALQALSDGSLNASDAAKVMCAYSGAALKIKYLAEYASEEETLKKLDQQIHSSDYDDVRQYLSYLNMGTEESREKANIVANKYRSKNDENIETALSKYRGLLSQKELIQYNLDLGMLDVAMKTSGVDAYTTSDVADKSTAMLQYFIASQWAKEGVKNVFDANGNITEDALANINSKINNNNILSSTYASNKRFMTDYIGSEAYGERDKLLKAYGSKYGVTNFRDLFNLAKTTKFAEKDDVRNQILKLDTDNLSLFAHKLGLTTEELINSGNAYASVSEADISGTLIDLQNHFTSLSEVLDELTNNGYLSVETLDKVIETMPYLLKSVDDNAKIKLSQDNISWNLMDILLGGTAIDEYAGYSAFLAQTDDDRWKLFKEVNGGNDPKKWKKIFGGNLSEEDAKKLASDTTTFSEVQDLIYDNNDVYQLWADTIVDLTATIDKLTNFRASLVKYEQKVLDNEISNIQSIKDNLDSINKQREEEIKLLKAQKQLEDAQNDKKRVYRAGIGWTYEADQTAISEAYKAIDEAQNNKQAQDLQYQIDLLNQEKEMLGNVEADENWNNLKSQYDTFNDRLSSTGDLVQKISSIFGDGNIEARLHTSVEKAVLKAKTNRDENRTDSIAKVKEYSETAQAQWAYYDSIKNSNTVNASDKSNAYDEAVEASKKAYTAMVEYGNEYHITSDQWGDFDMVVGSPDGNGAKQTLSIKDIWNTYETEGAGYNNYSSAHFDPMNGYGLVFISPPFRVGLNSDNYAYKIDLDYAIPNDSQYFAPNYVDGLGLIYTYDYPTDTYSKRSLYCKDLKDPDAIPDFSIAHVGESMRGPDGSSAYIKMGNMWYRLSGANQHQDESQQIGFNTRSNCTKLAGYNPESYSSGTFNSKSGDALINENGTETIVTPNGILTSLPSKLGIDPSDLTSSLYDLANISPNLIQTIKSSGINIVDNNQIEDNSTNINSISTNFQVDEGFNFSILMEQTRQYIATTKNRR